MAKLIIHRIVCERPQENSVWSDGDEIWIRLEGNGVAYSPSSRDATWQMNSGRGIDINLEIEFNETARLEVWDSDSAIQSGPVDRRDNELLAFFSFMSVDDPAENDRKVLTPGSNAEGAVYAIRYSLKK